MKKRNRLKIAVLIFIIIMFIIIIFFMIRISNIKELNKSKQLLSYLYTLDSGDYSFKDGKVYNNDILLNERVFLDGNGSINIDKYKNVRFLIDSDNKCIYKTYLGNIKMNNKKCSSFDSIDVLIAKNNSKISFILNKNNLDYKISYKDDFKGEWIHKDYKDNLVLKEFNDGDNYIWFKDELGNISEVLKFNVDCLLTKDAKYDPSVFYCSGSTISLDNIDWVVLEDNNKYIKLMKYTPIEEKMSHCFNEKSDYCYYSKESKMPYKWSNSYINYYINNTFIQKLSDYTKKYLKTYYICDEYNNYTCDNEICGGYTKEEIEYNDWKCTNYTSSKIKIISYDEFNRAYIKIKDKDILDGNYWSLNSYKDEKGSSVSYNYEFYILEDYTNKLDVKPIISIEKVVK